MPFFVALRDLFWCPADSVEVRNTIVLLLNSHAKQAFLHRASPFLLNTVLAVTYGISGSSTCLSRVLPGIISA